VLGLVRSVKNSFAPINRIPSEVLSLIPDYSSSAGFEDQDAELLELTHVCRGWREIFTSRSSLWATLTCENVEKTRVYIERSKSSPLNIYLTKTDGFAYSEGALRLVTPHVSRLGSLIVWGTLDTTQDLTRHFSRPAPVLRRLDIIPSAYVHALTFPATLFNGDISPVRELRLSGFTQLPWRNMSNLEVFELRHKPGTANAYFLTQLLDLFESAPLLSRVDLTHFIPVSSNAPSGRVVPIPHLKKLTIRSPSGHYALLEHLSIPTGASLILRSPRNAEDSPIFDHLPKNINNLNNISHVTSVSLRFSMEAKCARLKGPSGELYLHGAWIDGDALSNIEHRRIFSSLEILNPFSTQWLAVTEYTSSQGPDFDKSHIPQTLLLMNDLRILTLIECDNLPFIHALNPEKNGSSNVPCPHLEELVLYIKKLDWFYTSELKEMVSARAESRAKRPKITIVSLGKMLPKQEVFTLRQYFPRVEYKVDVESPDWDALPGDGNDNKRGRGA